MKESQWYFMVAIAVIVLIITFFTKNIYVVIGTFALALYLQKFVKNIKIPEQYRKYNIVSQNREITVEKNQKSEGTRKR